MSPSKYIEASWYDYPQYYDMAFRDDTAEEAKFLDVVWRKTLTPTQPCNDVRPLMPAPTLMAASTSKYCDFEVRRILEPACGTGRVVTALAQRGYEMLGFDLSDSMLRYASNRTKRRKLDATFFNADMRDFELAQPVDMAYNPVNSFRYLLTEKDAQQHLKCMANAIRPGGLYILAMHLLPMDVDEESTERWSATHGRTKLTATLRVLESDRRKRLEKLRISLLVRSGEKEFRLRHEFQFRMYTAAQMKRTLAAVPDFELLDVYDFWYDIDEPQELNDVITDTVFVLRKR